MSTTPVSAIIFDLGNVLYRIDYRRTIDAMARLGLPDAGSHFSQMQQSEIFDAYETGKISTHTFFETLNRMLPQPTHNSLLEEAWNAILIGMERPTLDFLAQLHARMPIFLLSNTNAIHIETVNAQLQSAFGVESLKPFFSRVYYSFEVGLRKPDPEIFKLVLRENGLWPQSTLFIDDSPQHIASAAALGIQTHHFKPEVDRVEQVVEQYLSAQ